MATIKSYTSLEQSRKLAEILPLESADMWYQHTGFSIKDGSQKPLYFPMVIRDYESDEDIPCWSLAALLGVLEHPRCFQGDKPIYWFCGCFGKDELYHEVEADNPVDACYKMIIHLSELKML